MKINFIQTAIPIPIVIDPQDRRDIVKVVKNVK